MKTLNSILVAVPASPKYHSIVQYAIGMAHDLDAKLTIALTYSQVPTMAGESAEALNHQKDYLKSSFEQLKSQALHKTPVDYRLISLDGPLCEAILAAGPTYHPDLVITAADEYLALPKMVRNIPYHLLLVPLNTLYQPIKHIGLAYDAMPMCCTEPVEFVDQFAMAYDADVDVVEFGASQALASHFTNRSNLALDFFLKDVIHRFNFTIGEGSTEDVKDYINQYHPHLLVVLARHHLPADTNPSDRHTVAIAKVTTVPVLVLKS